MTKFIKYVAVSILATTAFIACNDENAAPEISTSNLADTTISVGKELALEASIKSDLVFNYYWTLNNEKADSDAIFVFTPEASGEYTIKLVVENKFGKDSTEAVITVLP